MIKHDEINDERFDVYILNNLRISPNQLNVSIGDQSLVKYNVDQYSMIADNKIWRIFVDDNLIYLSMYILKTLS